MEKLIAYMIVASLLAAAAGVAAYMALGSQHEAGTAQQPAAPAETATSGGAGGAATPTASTQHATSSAGEGVEVRSLPKDPREVVRCYPSMRVDYSSEGPGGVENGYMMYRLERSGGGYLLTFESSGGGSVKVYFDEGLRHAVKIVMPNGYTLTGPMAESMGERMLNAIGGMIQSLAVGGKLEMKGGKMVSPDGTVVIVGQPSHVKARINGEDHDAYKVTIKTPNSVGVDHSEILVAKVDKGLWMVVSVKSYKTDGTVSSWAITSLKPGSSCQG